MSDSLALGSTPEIGQALFGCPVGDFAMTEPEVALVDHALSEIGRVYWNRNQTEWDQYADPCIPGVAFRPYCWSDCTCGWSEKEFSADHESDCYQTALAAAEAEAGVGLDPETWEPRRSNAGLSYKAERVAKTRIYKTLTKQFGLPLQGCAVHCTCSHRQRMQEWFVRERLGPDGHAVDCAVQLPNLAFDGLEIRWYKHPGRGSTVNQKLTPAQWHDWLNRCLEAICAADVR